MKFAYLTLLSLYCILLGCKGSPQKSNPDQMEQHSGMAAAHKKIKKFGAAYSKAWNNQKLEKKQA